MTARAMDALAVRNIIADDFRHHSYMRLITQKTLEAQFDSMALKPGTQKRSAQLLMEELEDTITGHPVFWINRDMQTLAVAAAEKLRPEDMVFHFPNTPCNRGLLVFAEPLTGIDIRGRTTRTHAVSWTRFGDMLALALWINKHDMLDNTNSRLKDDDRETFDMTPDYGVWHVIILEEGGSIPAGVTMKNGTVLPVDFPIAVDGKGGVILPEDIEAAYDLEFAYDRDPVAKVMFSIWYLMRQTITDVKEEKAPRPMARASKRLELVPLVSVIILRQAKKAYLGTGNVEWSHRWLRRGHWRQQPYKDEDGQWRRRAKYIHQTVCGPEDKPLIIKDKVTALVR